MNWKLSALIIASILLIVLIGVSTWRLNRKMDHQQNEPALVASVRTHNEKGDQQTKDQALITSIRAHDDQKTLHLLAEGASGEAHDMDTSAHLAALPLLFNVTSWKKGPDPVLVRALLNHGAQVSDRDIVGKTPLGAAAGFQSSEIVKLLLEHGADVEAKDTDGYTPLMTASADGAKVLLAHGANIEAKDQAGNTTLILAAYTQQLDLVRVLLKHGANASARSADGITALYWATGRRDPDALKIAALLRQYGAK
jgi:ankyrin repeat protein